MKEITLRWFIENCSHCWHDCGFLFVSPAFTLIDLERTSWFLWLNPRKSTVEKQKSISIHLVRTEKDAGPEIVALKFEISVLASDLSILQSKSFKFAFRKGFANGYDDVLCIKELMRRRSEYLPQDILSVQCKIWFGEGSIQRAAQFTARTRIGIEKISYLHDVPSFSTLKPNEENTFLIQSVVTPNCIICNSVYFTEAPLCDGEIIVKTRSSHKNYILMKQKISLLNGSGNAIECSVTDNRYFAEVEEDQKSPLSLTRKAIVDGKEEYLPNDELSLLCENHFTTGIEISKIEEVQHHKPITMTIEPELDAVSSKKGDYIRKMLMCPGALQDFKKIYSNQILSDVELKTIEKSFPAHKIVLSARSSVFEAMLTDAKGKNTNCIQVNDLEDDTVQQLLLFLYTDSIESLQWKSAIKLYYAGDKYAIEKLKLICSFFLVDNLRTFNASELLLLADERNDSDLKNFVVDFILDHEDDIFGSDEWEKLFETNPQLVLKTMLLKYKRKKEGV